LVVVTVLIVLVDRSNEVPEDDEVMVVVVEGSIDEAVETVIPELIVVRLESTKRSSRGASATA
jgi:hypothetical protein